MTLVPVFQMDTMVVAKFHFMCIMRMPSAQSPSEPIVHWPILESAKDSASWGRWTSLACAERASQGLADARQRLQLPLQR
jgi:hypothetical protein